MHWRIYEHGMEFGWLFVIIFSVLIFLGIIQLVNMLSRNRSRETHGESPLHILKRRYAKGEISKEEFEKMKDELTKDICKK
jgi:putative membrane protein